MARKPSKAQLNSSIRKLQSAANDLNRHERRLKAAGRDLDHESHRARSRLRQLPRSQPPVSISEEALLTSVSEHVATDPVDRPHDIFLSHATADLELARELHNELEALDAEVSMDDFSIKLGQNIVRAIDRGISLARVGVVLVTPAVIAGRY